MRTASIINTLSSTGTSTAVRLRNFRKLVKGACFARSCKEQLSLDAESLMELTQINLNPASFLDKKLYLVLVPVALTSEVISAFPNGYFDGDPGPRENFALSEELHESHGYNLFGIGASYLGYRRSTPTTSEQAKNITSLLCSLYSIDERKHNVSTLTDAFTGSKELFVRYTGGRGQ